MAQLVVRFDNYKPVETKFGVSIGGLTIKIDDMNIAMPYVFYNPETKVFCMYKLKTIFADTIDHDCFPIHAEDSEGLRHVIIQYIIACRGKEAVKLLIHDSYTEAAIGQCLQAMHDYRKSINEYSFQSVIKDTETIVGFGII